MVCGGVGVGFGCGFLVCILCVFMGWVGVGGVFLCDLLYCFRLSVMCARFRVVLFFFCFFFLWCLVCGWFGDWGFFCGSFVRFFLVLLFRGCWGWCWVVRVMLVCCGGFFDLFEVWFLGLKFGVLGG